MSHYTLSIITTYKNRKHHLVQTVPTWIFKDAPIRYEIVLVDYGVNPDELLPVFFSSLGVKPIIIKYVQCFNLDEFCLSHARNIGAREASGEWLLFIDIDTKLLSGIIDFIVKYTQLSDYYFAAVDSLVRKDIINGGLILVKKEYHDSICGFNENLKGWGFEDIDYKQRLEKLLRLQWYLFPNIYYECIDHPDTERVRCYNSNKEISWMKNRQIALETWKNTNFGDWTYRFNTVYGK